MFPIDFVCLREREPDALLPEKEDTIRQIDLLKEINMKVEATKINKYAYE